MSNYFDLNYRYGKLIKLIECKNTGTPHILAKELRISERQLYRMIRELKFTGINILYNRRTGTYYIKQD